MRDELKHKQVEYRRVFDSEAGKEVLCDLIDFCHVLKTTANTESVQFCPYTTARREGRREVFLQIFSMLKVDFSELYDLYNDDDVGNFDD